MGGAWRRLLAGAIFLGAAEAVAAASITFDDVAAPPFYFLVLPGGPDGPLYSRSGVTFHGGLVLLGPGGIPTPPNAYGSSDFRPLANGSTLPGIISAQLDTPATSVSLTAFNGAPTPTQLTLSAFSAANTLLRSDSFSAAAFGFPGFLAALAVSATGIDHFTVTSSQARGAIDFGIDNVITGPTAVPEPASVLMAGSAILIGLGYGWRRRRRTPD